MSQQIPDSVRFGGVLFSYAFRPFFLLVAAYAILMVLGWVLFLAGFLPWPEFVSPRVWHGHEMIFGFAGGAIAGFLLTAVATWTGQPPIAGKTLMGLCAIWLLARLGAMAASQAGWAVSFVASLLFWSALLGLMAREVVTVRNTRNYKVLIVLSAFLATEAVFFLSTSRDISVQEACLRAGLLLVLGMISLIGGRIIPAFTQNWLRMNRPKVTVQLPACSRVDGTVVLVTLLFAVGFVLWPELPLTGWLGLLAALVHAVRLIRWRGWLTRAEPLLWILHVGYAWIPVGFMLLGLAILRQSPLLDSGIHALAYGAIGTLILGVAARVALGHTGRALHAFPAIHLAFLLVTAGGVCRVLTPIGGGLLWISAGLWVTAYGLFLLRYAPILLLPRLHSG